MFGYKNKCRISSKLAKDIVLQNYTPRGRLVCIMEFDEIEIYRQNLTVKEFE